MPECNRICVGLAILGILSVSVAKCYRWSKCSVSCGGGYQLKRQSCARGSPCFLRRECNTAPCIDWGKWQRCSKSCGGGHQFKVDWCPIGNVDTCPKTYRSCNTQACPRIQSCPYRYEYRYKDESACCRSTDDDCGVTWVRSGKIIGGEEAAQGQWPWAAALIRHETGSLYCGGSLIHTRWVVTAAHCIAHPQPTYVLLGSNTLRSLSADYQAIRVVRFYTPRDYVLPYNDIGLLKLQHDAVITEYVKPVCLPSGEMVPVDATCRVIGWGRTNPEIKESLSDVLKEARVKVFPNDACVQIYKKEGIFLWTRINEKHICSGTLSEAHGPCHGDSGGALICQRCTSCGWYLAGIVSGGSPKCDAANFPGVFTNTYFFEDWIREYIGTPRGESFVCWVT